MKQLQCIVEQDDGSSLLTIYLVSDEWEPDPMWPVYGTLVIPEQSDPEGLISTMTERTGLMGEIGDRIVG